MHIAKWLKSNLVCLVKQYFTLSKIRRPTFDGNRIQIWVAINTSNDAF